MRNNFFLRHWAGIVCLMCAVVFSANVFAIDISGTVNASTLPDSAEIVLVGNTNIYMDVDKTLKSIQADFPLVVSGDNTLSLYNKTEDAIFSEGDVNISGGNINVKSFVVPIHSLKGDISLNGNITVSASGGNQNLVFAPEGSISLNGNITLMKGSYGFHAKNDIIVEGGDIHVNAYENSFVSRLGNITLNGNVTAAATQGNQDIIYAPMGTITTHGNISLSKGRIGLHGTYGVRVEGGSLEIDVDSWAIYARKGAVSVSGDMLVKTKYSAIEAREDVSIDNVTIDVKGGYDGNVIFSEKGKITVKGSNITINGGRIGINARDSVSIEGGNMNIATNNRAISSQTRALTVSGTTIVANTDYNVLDSYGDITLNNVALSAVAGENSDMLFSQQGGITAHGTDIVIKGGRCGINARNDVLLEGGKISVEVRGRAIYAQYGAMTLASDVVAKSTDYHGIEAYNNITVNNVSVLAVAGGTEGVAMFSHEGTISLSGVKVLSPTESSISEGTVLDGSDPAKRVYISKPSVSGSVELTSEPAPGSYISFTLKGDVAMTVISQVWQISDDGIAWSDIEEATDGVYLPTIDQIGKYLRVLVQSVGHEGYLSSPARRIAKYICTKVPEAPTLSISNNKVYVDNAKKAQEYIIYNFQRDPADLVESDWTYAVSPASNGSLEMTGVENSINYVYTRVKETASTLAGTDIEWTPIYNGPSVEFMAIKLSLEDRTRYFDIQDNELNCTLGDVIRITAAPVPSDATGWDGIAGNKWFVDGGNSSAYGAFYANEACTTPLNASLYYSTVYFKTLQQKSCVELRAETTTGQGTVFRAQAINIGDGEGNIALDHVTVNPVTIGSGEELSGIKFFQYPKSASLENLTAETTKSTRVPLISFNVTTGKMYVDARNADQGEYTYTLKRSGETIPDQFTVTVTKGRYDVDSLIMRTKYITADPGEVVEIVPLLYPASSEAEILWYTTDETNGPVVNGKVTIANDAPIGTEIYITAIAMGRYDNCKITVSGEEYGLFVASTQVTSRNREDILGDGKFSFDGLRTLTMNGDVTLNTPVRLVQNTDIDNLLIEVADNSTVTQQSGVNSVIFDLHKNTTITGKKLSITGNTIGINVTGNSTLTLDSADLYVYAEYPLTGNISGNDSLSIIASRVEVQAKGDAAVDDFHGGISLVECVIQTPAGGEVVDATIENGSGIPARNLLIVPYHDKAKAWLLYFQPEMTAVKGEAFVAQYLWNPEELAVTYTSSDPSVATVDEATGDVELVAVGTTTITASFAGNEEYESAQTSYDLTVQESAPTGIDQISNDQSPVTNKVIRNGHLFILRNGKTYNALGAEVK